MSDPFDPGEARGREPPRCYESRPATGGGARRGRDRGGTPMPAYGACGQDSRIFYETTLAEMGVAPDFPSLYAQLLQGSRRADNMSYDRFCQLRGDPDMAQQLVEGVINNARDALRDRLLQRIIPGALLEGFGGAIAFGELAQSAAERGLWERESAEGRQWRRQRLFWLLLAGAAIRMSGDRDMTRRAQRILRGLVTQVERYELWHERYWDEYAELADCERVAGGWPMHNGRSADIIHAAP